jgi:hypothetical protein
MSWRGLAVFRKRRMRILIVNRFIPPEPESSAMLFEDIAAAMRERGHEVVFAGSRREHVEEDDDASSAWRIVREWAGIFWKACLSPRPEVVLTGSFPRGLPVVGRWIARLHRAAHLHWCIEKFPESSVPLRLAQRPWQAGIWRHVMRRAARRAALVAAVDTEMVAAFSAQRVAAVECRPWAPGAVFEHMPFPPPEPEPPWTWLYSGTLGRAHDWQTLLAAQAELESRRVDATLVFQGGGEAWPAARTRAKDLGLQRVAWRPPVVDAEFCRTLLRSHCLVASQIPELRGLRWPSKLALLLGMPRPLLYVGAVEGATASLVAQHPLGRCFSSGDFRAVADWIEALRLTPVGISFGSTVDVASHRKQALASWVAWIESRAGQKV